MSCPFSSHSRKCDYWNVNASGIRRVRIDLLRQNRSLILGNRRLDRPCFRNSFDNKRCHNIRCWRPLRIKPFAQTTHQLAGFIVNIFIISDRFGGFGSLVERRFVALRGRFGRGARRIPGGGSGVLGGVGAPGGEAGERLPPVPAGRGLPAGVRRLGFGLCITNPIRTFIRLHSRRYHFRCGMNRIVIRTGNIATKRIPNCIITQIPLIRLIRNIRIRIARINESIGRIFDIIYCIANQTLARKLLRMRSRIYDNECSRKNNNIIATLTSRKNLSYQIVRVREIVSN